MRGMFTWAFDPSAGTIAYDPIARGRFWPVTVGSRAAMGFGSRTDAGWRYS